MRIGIIGAREAERAMLRESLGQHGLDVAVETELAAFLGEPPRDDLQALLVDLHGARDEDLQALDAFLDREDLPPLLFNEDAPANREKVWVRRLAAKLAGMAATAAAGDTATNVETPLPAVPVVPRVWVLGASFGGPEAVKRFFDAVPEVPDATFLLVQHIGDGFVDLLASQLDRSTPFHVEALSAGTELQPGRVYVMPVDYSLHLNGTEQVELRPDPTPDRNYSPNIDGVMREVARAFGSGAGAIVFSGMGNDGTEGVQAVAAAGGEVWAQDAASCPISSMPDCAAATGVITRRGNPEELARALVQYLRSEQKQP